MGWLPRVFEENMKPMEVCCFASRDALRQGGRAQSIEPAWLLCQGDCGCPPTLHVSCFGMSSGSLIRVLSLHWSCHNHLLYVMAMHLDCRFRPWVFWKAFSNLAALKGWWNSLHLFLCILIDNALQKMLFSLLYNWSLSTHLKLTVRKIVTGDIWLCRIILGLKELIIFVPCNDSKSVFNIWLVCVMNLKWYMKIRCHIGMNKLKEG